MLASNAAAREASGKPPYLGPTSGLVSFKTCDMRPRNDSRRCSGSRPGFCSMNSGLSSRQLQVGKILDNLFQLSKLGRFTPSFSGGRYNWFSLSLQPTALHLKEGLRENDDGPLTCQLCVCQMLVLWLWMIAGGSRQLMRTAIVRERSS